MSQSAYELLRDANIAKNNEVLRGLGLIGSSLTGLQHSTIPNPKPVRVGPPRRSKRKRDLEVTHNVVKRFRELGVDISEDEEEEEEDGVEDDNESDREFQLGDQEEEEEEEEEERDDDDHDDNGADHDDNGADHDDDDEEEMYLEEEEEEVQV